MDNDSKLEQYVLLAKGLRGLALRDLIAKATAEPGLFTFGELLCLPAVQEVRGRSAAPSIETCPPPPLCRRPTCCLPDPGTNAGVKNRSDANAPLSGTEAYIILVFRRVAEMKVAHACVLLLACAHSGECGRLVVKLLALYYYFASPFSRTSSLLPTAALAGRTTLAAEKQQVAFPPPPAVVPTPPLVSPPPPGSSPAAAFTTPGVRWRWCVPCTALLTLHLYQLTICLAPAARVWRQRCGLRGRQRRRGPADCDLQCHHRCLWPRQPW